MDYDFGQLVNIEKPGRYTNNEINAFHKNKKTKIKIALCFPDIYEIGMSNTGMSLLYNLLNSKKNVVCERVYSPFPDYETFLLKNNKTLVSLESKTPLNEFDLIGFSYQYELAITNILNILKLANIPILTENRTKHNPIIICGGPCTVNPIPLQNFFDCLSIGDGENVFEKIIEILDTYPKKKDRLKNIFKIESIYYKNCEKEKTVKRSIVYDYSKYLEYYKPIIPNIDIVHNRINIEIMRGCTRGCRFCLAGYINRPTRIIQPEIIKKYIDCFVKDTGFSNVTLSSLSSSDYLHIEKLLQDILPEYNKEKINVNVPSLRIDTLERLIKHNLNKNIKTSITIAPEAGTESLRKRINKNLSDEEIENALKLAVDNGYQSIKLYFMIGLPHETMDDIEGIVKIVKNISYYGKKKLKKIKVAISNFVPKPHTPLQWFEYADEESYEKKIQYICSQLTNRKLISVVWHSYKTSLIEAIIARGDEKTGNIILDAFNSGAKFDDWKEYFDFEIWKNAIQKNNSTINNLISKKNIDEPLPWDCIDIGIKKNFILNELKNYCNEIQVQDCKIEKCNNCSSFLDCSQQKKLYKKKWNIPTFSKQDEKNYNYEENKNIKTNNKFIYRIVFAKTYKIKFISHLDLQKILINNLRFFGIKFNFSNGFHKRPKIELSSALSLGFIGINEIVDIETIEAIEIEKFIKKFNSRCKGTIKIHSIDLLEKKKKSLNACVISNEYSIILNKNSNFDLENLKKLCASKIFIKNKEINLPDFILFFNFKKYKNFDIVTLKIKNTVLGTVNPFQIIKNLVQTEYIKNIIRKKINL